MRASGAASISNAYKGRISTIGYVRCNVNAAVKNCKPFSRVITLAELKIKKNSASMTANKYNSHARFKIRFVATARLIVRAAPP